VNSHIAGFLPIHSVCMIEPGEADGAGERRTSDLDRELRRAQY
jgi:hypothetical protein